MNNKNIHFVGIKGVGMTALAIYCKERGYQVNGSDINEEFHTDKVLRKYAIPVYNKFSKENIKKDIDLVIYSGAYDVKQNVEVVEAKNKKIPVISHGEALGKFMSKQKGISIAGTHGKTTSSAILATIFMQAGLDPSYVIGCAEIATLPSPGHFGKGTYFIAEADEYQTAVNVNKKSRFLWQNPSAALITNIEYDHPDVFKDIGQVKEAFLKFMKKIPQNGYLAYNGDDPSLIELVSRVSCKLISFGEGANNQYRLNSINFREGKTNIQIRLRDENVLLELNIPGRHNAINVCGVYALAKTLGLKTEKIIKAVKTFKGSKRRFEKIATKKGVLYYDDYAHHPTEIDNTLISIKNWFPKKKIIVIFQPHTYSRTKSLLNEFVSALKQADIIIITKIFASQREKSTNFNISGKILADKISQIHPQVYFANTFNQVVKYLKELAKKGNIVITMGAGDIYKLHDLI